MGASPFPLPKVPDTFWAYFAGLFDGEGSLGMYSNGPRLSISNTHRGVLDEVNEVLGFGRVWAVQNVAPDRHLQCFQYDCGARGMRLLLPRLQPFLRVKAERATLFLEYLGSIDPDNIKPVGPGELTRRAEIRESLRIRRSNDRGR